MKLLLSQRNRLFELINDMGFSPAEFDVTEVTSPFGSNEIVSKCSHKESGYYFFFDFFQNKFLVRFSPGREKEVEQAHTGDWPHSLHQFQVWLADLKREVEAPDLWGELLGYSASYGEVIQDSENSKLSHAEVIRIETSVQQVKSGVQTLQLPEEQLEIINSKLDAIAERAKNLGRIDWKNAAIGMLGSVLLEMGKAGINHETIKTFIHLVKVSFTSILLLGS